ncbi:hypothetical protein L1887_18068 [Cichorium endivia]|nr:hypothetical protein L1887_18068 [Cichorium endivia]
MSRTCCWVFLFLLFQLVPYDLIDLCVDSTFFHFRNHRPERITCLRIDSESVIFSVSEIRTLKQNREGGV